MLTLTILTCALLLLYVQSNPFTCIPDGNNIIVSMAIGMGLQNQIGLINKAILIANQTSRHVCVDHFMYDYRKWPSIPIDLVIDLNSTNARLASIGIDTKTTFIAATTDLAKRNCVCLLYQGDANLPRGGRKCVGGWKTVNILREDPAFTSIPDFLSRPAMRSHNSVCITPGLPFYQSIAGFEVAYGQITHSLVFAPYFYELADFVRLKDGICQTKCTGKEKYTAFHLRLEDDWIRDQFVKAHNARYIAGFPDDPMTGQVFAALYVNQFYAFLNRTMPIGGPFTKQIVHVATGVGQHHHDYNSVLDDIRVRVGRMSMYNHSNFFTYLQQHGGDAAFIEMVKLLPLGKQFREIHALVDYIITIQASQLIGFCESAFTIAARELVAHRHRDMQFHCFHVDVDLAHSYNEQERARIVSNHRWDWGMPSGGIPPPPPRANVMG